MCNAGKNFSRNLKITMKSICSIVIPFNRGLIFDSHDVKKI